MHGLAKEPTLSPPAIEREHAHPTGVPGEVVDGDGQLDTCCTGATPHEEAAQLGPAAIFCFRSSCENYLTRCVVSLVARPGKLRARTNERTPHGRGANVAILPGAAGAPGRVDASHCTCESPVTSAGRAAELVLRTVEYWLRAGFDHVSLRRQSTPLDRPDPVHRHGPGVRRLRVASVSGLVAAERHRSWLGNPVPVSACH